jgi:hypothetical protein
MTHTILTPLGGPKPDVAIHHRMGHCLLDLRPHVRDLIGRAETVGWYDVEVVMAVASISDDYLIEQAASRKSVEDVKRAIARQDHGNK